MVLKKDSRGNFNRERRAGADYFAEGSLNGRLLYEFRVECRLRLS